MLRFKLKNWTILTINSILIFTELDGPFVDIHGRVACPPSSDLPAEMRCDQLNEYNFSFSAATDKLELERTNQVLECGAHFLFHHRLFQSPRRKVGANSLRPVCHPLWASKLNLPWLGLAVQRDVLSAGREIWVRNGLIHLRFWSVVKWCRRYKLWKYLQISDSFGKCNAYLFIYFLNFFFV